MNKSKKKEERRIGFTVYLNLEEFSRLQQKIVKTKHTKSGYVEALIIKDLKNFKEV